MTEKHQDRFGEITHFHETDGREMSDEEVMRVWVAWCVVMQADSMPESIVKKQGDILDFYLDALPTQTYAIADLIANYNPEEWDD